MNKSLNSLLLPAGCVKLSSEDEELDAADDFRHPSGAVKCTWAHETLLWGTPPRAMMARSANSRRSLRGWPWMMCALKHK